MNKTLGKKKLVRDISASTVQTVMTQLFGLVIFYITSKVLSKNDFGEFNWSMAVGATILAVASLGLDLVFVKKIALGRDILVISGIHFFHTLLAGVILCSAVFLIRTFVPSFNHSHPLFFLVFLNLSLANVANSFKLCLNGLEAYKQLAILSLCVNLLKCGLIVFFYMAGSFTIVNVIFAYMAASGLEFLLAYRLLSHKLTTRIRPLLKVTEYKYFILESLPQLGVILFDSALARIDWILLGVLSTQAATAEYSFTYKIFELSKAPMLIIAPVLLTRFSKLFNNEAGISAQHRSEIQLYLKLEMFVIMLMPIVLICAWSPLMDYFTDNKYGAVNETSFWLLAICVPLHALINFLWTIGFVQGQLKVILFITVLVSVLNIAANAVLIPLYDALGAAIAFLVCTLIQLGLYLKLINQTQVKPDLRNIALSFVAAFAAVAGARLISQQVVLTAALALFFFIAIIFSSGQLSLKQLKQLAGRS